MGPGVQIKQQHFIIFCFFLCLVLPLSFQYFNMRPRELSGGYHCYRLIPLAPCLAQGISHLDGFGVRLNFPYWKFLAFWGEAQFPLLGISCLFYYWRFV